MSNPFKPGHDPRRNTKGRKKGSPNKSTEELRSMVQQFIEGNFDDIQSQYDQMDPKDKLSFIERLLKHVLPNPLHELERLSDESLTELIERLRDGRYKHQNN